MARPNWKEHAKDYLRRAFDTATLRLERGHRDGLRILAKQILGYRWLVLVIFFVNLWAALFEGGTIGLLGIAVSVLVDNQTTDIAGRFGMLGPYIAALHSEVGRGGLFLVLVVAAVLAQMFKSGMTYLGAFFSIKLRFRVNEELQQRVVNQAMSLSYDDVGRYPAGTISAVVGQAGAYSKLIKVFNKIVLATLMLVIYLTVMVAMSVPLTLAAILIVVILGFSISGVIRTLKSLGESMASATVRMGKLTYEYLQMPRLLRVFNATRSAEKIIARTRREMFQSQANSEKLKAGVDPATDALTVAGAGAFLVIGYLVAGQNATTVIPSLLLFVLVLNRMMPQVKTFNQARMDLYNELPTVQRVAEFLQPEGKSYARTGGKPFKGLEKEIRFENVGFRYPDSQEDALADIDFTLRKGDTTALAGVSGAGKSTLVDLLLGLHDPSSGRILVDGEDLRDLSLSDWRERIGVVDQEVYLMNSSVYDNITFPRMDIAMEDVVAAAKVAYAHDFIMALPHKYDTVIGDRGYRLSGGQQQRLALARAFVRNPQILVLDEATSALDTGSERMIQNTLEKLHHHKTMLVIAHRLSTLVHADRIIVLEHGRIVEEGTWGELVEQSGTFQKYWKMQMSGSMTG